MVSRVLTGTVMFEATRKLYTLAVSVGKYLALDSLSHQLFLFPWNLKIPFWLMPFWKTVSLLYCGFHPLSKAQSCGYQQSLVQQTQEASHQLEHCLVCLQGCFSVFQLELQQVQLPFWQHSSLVSQHEHWLQVVSEEPVP